jgi:hypothetical protein
VLSDIANGAYAQVYDIGPFLAFGRLLLLLAPLFFCLHQESNAQSGIV